MIAIIRLVLVHPFKILFRPLLLRPELYQIAGRPRKVNARSPGRGVAETLNPIVIRTQVKWDFDYYQSGCFWVNARGFHFIL